MALLCKAPWLHVFQRTTNEFFPCCFYDLVDTEYKAETKFEQHWNGKSQKDLRVKMMTGGIEVIPQCSKCVNATMTSLPYKKYDALGVSEEEIIKHTSSDGVTDLLPRSIDLRTSLCNFKCRTCSPDSSTSIAAEMKHPIPILPVDEDYHWITEELALSMRTAYWAGGEPFMNPSVYRTAQKLIDVGNTSLPVSFNTNLSFPGNTFNKAISLLRKFTRLTLYVSVDAFGEVGSFLRVGWNQELFLSNTGKIHQMIPSCEIRMVTCVTNLTLYQLPYMYQMAARYNCDLVPMVQSAHGNNTYLECNVLTQEEFDQCIVRLKQCADQLPDKLKQSALSFSQVAINHYKPRLFTEEDNQHCLYHEQHRGGVGLFYKLLNGRLNVERE